MEPVELRKEVVRTVKDVVGTGLNRYLLNHLGVMDAVVIWKIAGT